MGNQIGVFFFAYETRKPHSTVAPFGDVDACAVCDKQCRLYIILMIPIGT